MTDERFAPAAAGTEVDPEAERIVAEIEVTRTEMEGTIGEIGHRLQPETIVGQAREQLREATVGKVERLMDDAGQTAQRTGNTMVETIRENPVPAALAALGIGWLAMRMRAQQSSSYGVGGTRSGNGSRYGPGYATGYATGTEDMYRPRSGDPMSGVRDTADRAAAGAQDVADEAMYRAQRLGEDVQGAARDVADKTQETVQQAQWQMQGTVDQAQRQFDRTLQENPLALGALAVGVGAAVALAIPETQKERELMGEHRDRLVSEAQSVAGQALDQTEQKVEEVGEQIRSES
jgi:hypothetical protein